METTLLLSLLLIVLLDVAAIRLIRKLWVSRYGKNK